MKRLSILLFLFLLTTGSFARSCSDREYDKVEYFAENAAHKIVNEYGGGQYVDVSIASCRYNSYTDQFKAKIAITWRGAVFSDNKYESDGKLIVRSDGTNANYEETYANEKLRNLKETLMWIAGAVVVLGKLNEGR